MNFFFIPRAHPFIKIKLKVVRGFGERNEGEWTGKVEIWTRTTFLAMGEARAAIFWPTKVINHSIYSDLQKLSITQYVLTYKNYQSLSIFWPTKAINHSVKYICPGNGRSMWGYIFGHFKAINHSLNQAYLSWQWVKQAKLHINAINHSLNIHWPIKYINQSISKLWPIKAINQSINQSINQ